MPLMQDLRGAEPMTRNYNAMLSPLQCSQHCDTQKGLKRARPSAQTDCRWPESHHVQLDKGNYLPPVATFAKDLKGLVPVGNPYLMAGEDIPDISQDFLLCTYHPRLVWKIMKRFGLWPTGSKVSILTPANASGTKVQSTNAGTHKIDGFTFKNKDGWWER